MWYACSWWDFTLCLLTLFIYIANIWYTLHFRVAYSYSLHDHIRIQYGHTYIHTAILRCEPISPMHCSFVT